VDQELLARNEYLAAENRILKAHLKGQPKLSDAERATLGEIGHRLGRKGPGDVATVAQPDTILAWYRKLVARKFDGSKARQGPGRPRIKREVEFRVDLRHGTSIDTRSLALCRIKQRASNCRIFTPARYRTIRSLPVRDFCSGAYTYACKPDACDRLASHGRGASHLGTPDPAGRATASFTVSLPASPRRSRLARLRLSRPAKRSSELTRTIQKQRKTRSQGISSGDV
jgi:hypothetical protein